MMKNPLTIALDYDETFTADKELFSLFIHAAKQRGHLVKFVTYRLSDNAYCDNSDIIADAEKLNIAIVFTEGKQKSSVTLADIWIDDSPVTIPSLDALTDFKGNL